MSLKKAFITLIIILGIFALAAWFGYRYFIVYMTAKYRAAYKMPPTVVQIQAVKRQNWQKTILATGSLSAAEGITVTPEVSGRITNIFFKSGTYVTEGTPLIQLYQKIVQAQLDKAKAQLELHRANLRRFTELYKKGYYDKADLDKAAAIVKSNIADVNNTQAQLDQTTIKAPFSGRLGLRQISIGDYLSPGSAVVDLQSIDPIRVDFNVPEIYLGQIKIGDKTTITSRALKNQVYTGIIYAFNSKIDPNSRMLGVRANVPNPNHLLVPGTFVEVTVYLGQPDILMMIPQTAVVYSLEGNYVYLMKNHKAVKTPITLGQKLDDNRIIVVKGLQVGDPVIIGGQEKLHDGAAVMTEAEAQAMTKKQQQHK
jgi:membrane fusion protein (multidrug efflux system)